ncbi:MAG TPA: TadE/TadG family type IV pilus assembly protein [Gemmatimonadaceae bacterium]
MKRVRGRFRDERGALVLEFALIVPILFFIVFGIIDFGRAYFTMNSLEAAVREGARYAAVLEKPADAPNPDDIKQRVCNFALTFGGDSLRTSQVTTSFDPDLETVTVTATYGFRPITPLLRMIGRDSIAMRQTAVFRWERATPSS